MPELNDQPPNIRRGVYLLLIALVAMLAAFVLAVTLWANDPVEMGEGTVTDTGVLDDVGKVGRGPVEPAEDSPRFDCRVHGNQRCGQQ